MNFKNLLYEINNAAITAEGTIQGNAVNVPSNKTLYTVDLETRIIHGPPVISIQGEHYAETVYFLVDRFYDHMDLAQTNCVIQYAIGDKAYVYAVPFCDISTYDGKIIIPWSVSLSATKTAGTVQYFIRFYLINRNSILDDPSQAEFSYSLSTLPTSGVIKSSLEISDDHFIVEDKELQLPERYFEFVNLINNMVENSTVYWHEANEPFNDSELENSLDELINYVQNLDSSQTD